MIPDRIRRRTDLSFGMASSLPPVFTWARKAEWTWPARQAIRTAVPSPTYSSSLLKQPGVQAAAAPAIANRMPGLQAEFNVLSASFKSDPFPPPFPHAALRNKMETPEGKMFNVKI